MKIEKLKPGMTVYDVHKHILGNTTRRTVGIWDVYIISVDIDSSTVTASWNSNKEKKYYKATWSKWRSKKPVLVKDALGIGYRFATRDEINALKGLTTLIK